MIIKNNPKNGIAINHNNQNCNWRRASSSCL